MNHPADKKSSHYMKPIYALLATLMLPLLACTADEPATPVEDTADPATEAPPPGETPERGEVPAAGERPPDPVEESAALDAETEAGDDVELALADPAEATDGPASSRFVADEHYRVLMPTQPTSSSPDQVEVAEVFWYGCPHCYTFEPFLAEWRQDLPSSVNFVRIPAVWNDQVRMHARAFYTAEALGKLEEIHTPMFREMHVNNNPLATEDALAGFFAEHGVEEDTFRETFRSFAVETKLRRADTLNRRYRVQSVPVVVVNGKYVSDADMVGGYEELLVLVDELAASENE
ncbi:MAG: thiol:disulfide interchange protein DsbA/DsbL [Gammaproteobacteria bacterium]|nr:thiol:disulfide interchange protein DsbA/DsbL [Gammaproteobacteria bacterium]